MTEHIFKGKENQAGLNTEVNPMLKHKKLFKVTINLSQ